MAFEWFRSWHGAPTDSKFLLIAKRAQVTPGMVSAVYWALLDYASQNDPRGSVEGFDTEIYAEWAGWEERDVIAIIAALTTKQAIIDGRLVAWDKRQPKREDPTAAERQARHRDAQRNAEVTRDSNVTNGVTQSNAVSREVTQENARSDKIRLDQIRPENDDDLPTLTEDHVTNGDGREKAIDALQEFGLFNQPMLMQFNNIWPELSGREDWVGRAVTVARDKGATSPAYAIKVLMNAIHTGRAPGQKPGKADESNDQSYEALRRRYIPEGWEDVVKH